MYKLIISDVDGTLLPESTTNINPEYFDVIRKLTTQGVQVVIASGRGYDSLHEVFGPIADIVWFIADGGATIKIGDHFETVGQIPREWVEEIWSDAQSIPEMDIAYCCPEITYCPFDHTDMYDLLLNSYKLRMKALNSSAVLPDEPCSKLSLFRKHDIEKVASVDFIPKWRKKLNVVVAGEWWIDCLMPNINKGTSLQYLLDKYSISPSDVLAFGDNMNDFEMLKLAGTSYAVSTARPELFEICDKVIDNYEKDGVLAELKKLI